MWKQVEDKELEEFTRAEQGLLSQDSILYLMKLLGGPQTQTSSRTSGRHRAGCVISSISMELELYKLYNNYI